jgi:hypothetical protein
MSTTINEENKIVLIDGTEVSVRPLKISLLRDFMKKFDEISNVAEDNNKSMDVLMQCAQIAMKQYKPEIADDISKLEDLLDLPTVYKVVEAASGINLGSTNLVGSAAAN